MSKPLLTLDAITDALNSLLDTSKKDPSVNSIGYCSAIEVDPDLISVDCYIFDTTWNDAPALHTILKDLGCVDITIAAVLHSDELAIENGCHGSWERRWTIDFRSPFKKYTPYCHWTEDKNRTWKTACGSTFTFITDGPYANKMRHCPYCGKTLHSDEIPF